MIAARVRRDPVAAFENELWLWFFMGVLKQRWAERRAVIPAPRVRLGNAI
jgi:hypothetical protein